MSVIATEYATYIIAILGLEHDQHQRRKRVQIAQGEQKEEDENGGRRVFAISTVQTLHRNDHYL